VSAEEAIVARLPGYTYPTYDYCPENGQIPGIILQYPELSRKIAKHCLQAKREILK